MRMRRTLAVVVAQGVAVEVVAVQVQVPVAQAVVAAAAVVGERAEGGATWAPQRWRMATHTSWVHATTPIVPTCRVLAPVGLAGMAEAVAMVLATLAAAAVAVVAVVVGMGQGRGEVCGQATWSEPPPANAAACLPVRRPMLARRRHLVPGTRQAQQVRG